MDETEIPAGAVMLDRETLAWVLEWIQEWINSNPNADTIAGNPALFAEIWSRIEDLQTNLAKRPIN